MPSFLRSFVLPLLALSAVVLVTPDAQAARHHHAKKGGRVSTNAAVSDPRYADIIMNPTTGEIYHQADPDGRRYPASLTKMMTLYLLFEALEQHKTTLGAQLDVSDYAATMPQTNLALTPGETIPVDTAIKALVVRSANDVAVVVAEALGGDVDHFAQMMTAKARALGMRNTVFRNPNGLPNSEQYTTARDMAKLGIALKRDFPRYYAYFNTRQFSWNGATYYTHNRVMLRYAGTDGIKTGFIGASGFNLVTSVTRGGRPLVGTVMGGVSGGWRDNRMIQLLDATYKTIAARGAARGKIYAENLPLAKNGSKVGMGIKPEIANATPLDAPALDENAGESGEESEEDTDKPALLPAKSEAIVVVNNQKTMLTAQASSTATAAIQTAPSQAVANSTSKSAGATNQSVVSGAASVKTGAGPVEDATVPPVKSPFSYATPAVPAKTAVAADVTNGKLWGIQVGAFSSHELADRAASQSRQLAKGALDAATVAIAGPDAGSAPVYRARLTGLTERQAKTACEQLIANNSPCFIFKTTN